MSLVNLWVRFFLLLNGYCEPRGACLAGFETRETCDVHHLPLIAMPSQACATVLTPRRHCLLHVRLGLVVNIKRRYEHWECSNESTSGLLHVYVWIRNTLEFLESNDFLFERLLTCCRTVWELPVMTHDMVTVNVRINIPSSYPEVGTTPSFLLSRLFSSTIHNL